MSKILVIEDELAVRENIAELLESENYDVVTAEDGFIGFVKALKCSPDLIISDVMMPHLDGHDVLKSLRKDPRTNCLPFIFLTARSDKSDIETGKTLGATRYLTKPFLQKTLLEAVELELNQEEGQWLNSYSHGYLDSLQLEKDNLNS